MTLVEGVWYDNELGKYPLFPRELSIHINKPHQLGIEPNSLGIPIVKCMKCHISRMFITGHDIYNCQGKK